jgi:hypothetical protein
MVVCNPQEFFFRPLGLLDFVVSIVFLVIFTELIVECVCLCCYLGSSNTNYIIFLNVEIKKIIKKTFDGGEY